MTQGYRKVGKVVETNRIHPDVRRQKIDMFCVKQRHKETWYYRNVKTVAEAIAYVHEHGTPPGISGPVWEDMVERMSLWSE